MPDNALEAYESVLARRGYNPRLAMLGSGGQVFAQKGNQVVTLMVGQGKGQLSVQVRGHP